MRVSFILESVGSDPNKILSVVPGDGIAVANDLMRERRIGAILVIVEGELVGIISERDVARGLSAHGPAVLDMTVGDLMTAQVITCQRDADVGDAVEMMVSNHIRHLPVLDEDTVVGIISMRDIVRFHLTKLMLDNEVLLDQVQALAAGEKLG